MSLPSIDPTLTAANVTPIMEAAGDWQQLASDHRIGIPRAIQERITKQHAKDRMQSRAAWEWWVHTDPSSSWDRLADALYNNGKDRVLEKVAQYLPKGVYRKSGNFRYMKFSLEKFSC